MKRSMKSYLFLFFLFASLGLGTPAVRGQAYGLETGQTAPLAVSGTFQFTRANAPPGQCGCFWMEGGGAQINRSFTPKWGATADLYYANNSNINATDEKISIFNYLFGPRYSYRTMTRYTPYGQVLFGISRVSSDYYAYKSGESALAAQAGLGVDVWITKHLSVPVEGNWVFSRAKNGVNTRQNNTQISVGVEYRMGPK